MEQAYNFECSLSEIARLNMIARTYGKRELVHHNPSSEDLKQIILAAMNRSTGVINGSVLENEYFPKIKADVFISYSHNDEELARKLTETLQRSGVNVFLDSQIWGSADALLKQLDEWFCKKKNSSSYDYDKRNYSTSLVHALLSMALFKAIDQARVAIFINTENSLPGMDLMEENTDNGIYNNDVTYSPWIYEELMMISTIIRNRQKILGESMRFDINKGIDLQMAFDVPTECLNPLSRNKLQRMIESHLDYGKDLVDLLVRGY